MRNLLFILPICFWASGMVAQSNCSKGDKAYSALKYSKAIEHYEDCLNKNFDPVAAENLADSYRILDQTAKAEYWYEKVVSLAGARRESRLYYAQILLSNGKTDEAREAATAYLNDYPDDSRAIAIIESSDRIDEFSKSAAQYEVQFAPFNSTAADYCPVWKNDVLIFSSEREGAGRSNAYTGANYSKIFQTDASLNNPKELKGAVNGRYNDGAACFTDNGATMYFTRNNSKKDNSDAINLIISSAQQDGGSWVEGQAFPYNAREFNTAHPTISPDGTMLIFSSDRPGGSGGMDLFLCRREGAGWGEPLNLGEAVNTGGNEMFPVFVTDTSLVFSSDAHAGMGGLDMFSTSRDGDYWTQPLNLGAPFNSAKDDFGLATKNGFKSGYFTSNRGNAEGIEHIYAFRKKASAEAPLTLNGIVVDEFTQIPLPGVDIELVNKKTGKTRKTITADDGSFQFPLETESGYAISGVKNGIPTSRENPSTKGMKSGEKLFVKLTHNDPRFTLNGHAINRETNEPIPGVIVRLLNTGTNKEETTTTNAEGEFHFQLAQQSDYILSGQKEKHYSSIKEASTRGLNRSTTLYVKLVLSFEEIDIGKKFELENIYYDYDKWNIRGDAARELDNLAVFMKNNPTVEIELSSHTDSRGKDDYNQNLSQKRAEAAVDYIVRKGIASARIKARGYGESKLVNRCGNGVNCSEEDHQMNRRTEVKILKM